MFRYLMHLTMVQVRAEKPNPIIFEDAVQRLNAVAMRRGTAAASALHAALPMLSHNPAQPATSPFFSTSSTRVSSSSSNSTSSSCGPAHGSPTSSYGKEGYDFGPLLPEQILHVGDDRRNDVWGARDAGISAWLWGYDVRSWAEVADRVLLGSQVGAWGSGGRRGGGALDQGDGNLCVTILNKVLGHEFTSRDDALHWLFAQAAMCACWVRIRNWNVGRLGADGVLRALPGTPVPHHIHVQVVPHHTHVLACLRAGGGVLRRAPRRVAGLAWPDQWRLREHAYWRAGNRMNAAAGQE